MPSLTRSPGGPSSPGAPCGETRGVVRGWGWPASTHGGITGRELTSSPVSPAGPGSPWFPEAPCKAQGGKREVRQLWSKALHACRALGKLCFKAQAGAGLSLSQRAEDVQTLLHPPSLRGCLNLLSARLSVIPRLPLHKNTRHHQDCIQQWISAPTAQRISGAPVYPKPLSGLWCFPMPADPSLLHPQ